MKTTIDSLAFRFFRDAAGGIVGERAIGAMALAKAERTFNRRDDVRTVWAPEECPDLSWMSDEERARPHEVVTCRLERRCGSCGAWECIASLGGIVDPDADFVRVIEAELALEASL